MTRIANDNRDAPFSDWIRTNRELDSVREYLSVKNTDLWIHRYSERNERKRKTIGHVIDQISLIEVKSFNATEPFAQNDTRVLIDLILRQGSIRNGRRRGIKVEDRRLGRAGCVRTTRWLGYHILQMSADRPDTSDRLIWDGRHDITEQMLIEILRFDRDPDHIGRALDTRRHHQPPIREIHPDLFVAAKSA